VVTIIRVRHRCLPISCQVPSPVPITVSPFSRKPWPRQPSRPGSRWTCSEGSAPAAAGRARGGSTKGFPPARAARR
jgi:hypothetical protein